MQYSNEAYLLIGGNVGDRIAYLHQARALLNLYSGKAEKVSAVYETAPWGIADQPAFLNQAILLRTSLAAEELLHSLLKAEAEIGRERREKFGPRTIDIDILLFNDDVYDLSNLSVPHPQLANRRFALQPLCEIAGEKMHPVLNKPIKQLLVECPDQLTVKVFEAPPL